MHFMSTQACSSFAEKLILPYCYVNLSLKDFLGMMYGSFVAQITNESKLIIDNLGKEIMCFEISELYATTINQKHCAVVIVAVLLLNPRKMYSKGQ